jgi:ubiquinol-cytochrome c reductase cytochrome b subunit
LSLWIRGDYVVSDATLNRFFSFHVIAIPLVLLGLVAAHIVALHEVGSNNPDGVEIKKYKDERGVPLDGIPFHPYYTVHDLFGVAVFLLAFCAIIFFAPEMGGYFLEANNFLPADSLKTPLHIAPVWYFTPFYSMLRATTDQFTWAMVAGVIVAFVIWYMRVRPRIMYWVPIAIVACVVGFLLRFWDAKFWGVVIMGGSVMILFGMPWLDRSPARSIRYRPEWHKLLYLVFVVIFVVLGYIGTQPPSPFLNIVSQIGTVFYFSFFLGMPIWSQMGHFKPVPDRIVFHPH